MRNSPLQRETVRARNYRHGHNIRGRRSQEYNAWSTMIKRCTNPQCEKWPRYGGRGIRVCAAWLNSFEAFLADVGCKPDPTFLLDRIDNDGHYEPGNVQWVSVIASARNKSTARLITIDGMTKCAAEWDEVMGFRKDTVKHRFRRGWRGLKLLSPVRSA